MLELTDLFLYFIIYSCLGWVMEVVCKLIEKKKFINRGFLVGPICPIYGYGVLAIILLVGSSSGDILAVFLKSILVCSILEYLTSYLMEKLFKARWWDYSKKKFNINGRICLETMIPFGLLGCFVIYILHPSVIKLVFIFNPNTRYMFALILLVVYLLDNIFTFVILNKIKHEIKYAKKDSTEAIKKYIESWLNNNSIFYRHIKSSYPNFIVNIKKFNEEVKKQKKKFKEEEKIRKQEFKKKLKKLEEKSRR